MQLAGRNNSSEQGMIIPIVLRGVEDLPEEIKGRIQYLDFSKYTTASANIRKNQTYVDDIGKVAKGISGLYRLFKNVDACKECDTFALPDPDTIKPLRPEGTPSSNPFPGTAGSR
jgi:hypothetical protein